MLDRRLDGGLDLLAVAHVAHDRRGVAALGRDLASCSGSIPASTTRAPRELSRRAVAAPMPRAAPVISTRRPAMIALASHCRSTLVGLDPKTVDCHREHLVVTDQHAQLDQLHIAENARRSSVPQLIGDLATARAARRPRAAAAHWRRRTIAGGRGRRATRSLGADNPARRASRSCWRHSYSQLQLCATRRITSSVSRRGSLPRGISAPANLQPRPEQPAVARERREQVRRPPVPARVRSRATINALTRPMSAVVPGGIRGAVELTSRSHAGRVHVGPVWHADPVRTAGRCSTDRAARATVSLPNRPARTEPALPPTTTTCTGARPDTEWAVVTVPLPAARQLEPAAPALGQRLRTRAPVRCIATFQP